MTLFDHKYRIEPARLHGWNYASAGSYFLTICTYKNKFILGNIQDGKMVLSDFGEVVQEELLKSFDIRSELTCDNYVIMPNHLHILVSLSPAGPLKKEMTKPSSLEPKSISSFIGGFKAAATVRINMMRRTSGENVWHPRFYDHIVRNANDFDRIFAYISNNPKAWGDDRFHRRLIDIGDSNQYPDNL